MTYDPASANPLAGNPLKPATMWKRRCWTSSIRSCLFFSKGGARVSLGARGGAFRSCGGGSGRFCPPPLGPGALGAGRRRNFPHWPLYANGLANGTDPEHPEYWGKVTGPRSADGRARRDRLCPAPGAGASLGSARRRAREATSRLSAGGPAAQFADNNWKFFRIMIDLGLERVGVDFDRSLTEQYLRGTRRRSISATAGIATATSAASTITFPSPCISTG